MDLKEDQILGNAVEKHWYYQSKALALKEYLKIISIHKILDVGAGSGYFSKYLLSNTKAIEAMCVDTGYERNKSQLVGSKVIKFEKTCDQYDADVVLLMDVLEHVDDDVGLLKDYVKAVPAGAYFMITVPAFEFMWSDHDVFLEHKRRYNLTSLDKTVSDAGLSIVNSSYYFGGVFPLAIITRSVNNFIKRKYDPASQLKKHSWFVNKFLYLICRIELVLVRYNRLAGLSVFCLAIKK